MSRAKSAVNIMHFRLFLLQFVYEVDLLVNSIKWKLLNGLERLFKYFLIEETEQTFGNMLILGNAYDIIGIKVRNRSLVYCETICSAYKRTSVFYA